MPTTKIASMNPLHSREAAKECSPRRKAVGGEENESFYKPLLKIGLDIQDEPDTFPGLPTHSFHGEKASPLGGVTFPSPR